MPLFEVQNAAFVRDRCLLEGSAYFDLNVNRCGTYKRAAFTGGQALIRGNV